MRIQKLTQACGTDGAVLFYRFEAKDLIVIKSADGRIRKRRGLGISASSV